MAKVPRRGRYNLLEKFSDRHGNSYSSQDSLILWMEMTPTTPTDLTNITTTTVSYINAPLSRRVLLPLSDTQSYWAAAFDDTLDSSATATSTIGSFDFSSLPDGGTPTNTSDMPFSISFWARVDNTAIARHLFTKDDGFSISYQAYIHASDNVIFRLYDATATKAAYISTGFFSPTFFQDWVHFAFTYDGRGSAVKASAGLKIYLNAQLQVPATEVDQAGFVGMKPDFSEPLLPGSSGFTSSELDGEMLEFSVWSTELGPTEITAIYNASLHIRDTKAVQSGFLNNPPRTILQARDNATGSYPTVSRVGDPGRTGRYNINFNDTSTVVFSDDVTVSYPADLTTQDQAYISQSIASPNTNATIEATGTVRKGVADANITFTPGEDLRPFVEDKLYASSKGAFTNPFYMTGSTVASVGLGFTSPLRSKTKIEIDITNSVAASFGFYNDYSISPMAYYNFSLARWEPIGWPVNTSFQGSSADGTTTLQGIAASGTLGFSRGVEMLYDNPQINCRPISTFGFPVNPRYHATSSQAIPASRFIDRPFLVEKVVYEVEVALDAGNDIGSTNSSRSRLYSDFTGARAGHEVNSEVIGPRDDRIGGSGFLPSCWISTFFILNQRSPFSASLGEATVNLNTGAGKIFPSITSSIPSSIVLSPGASATFVTSSRDLVTYNQMTYWGGGNSGWATYYPMEGEDGALSAGLARELVMGPTDPSANAYLGFDNKQLVISGTVKVASSMPSTNTYRWTTWGSGARIVPRNAGGRRADIMSVSGRGLTAEVPGSPLLGSYKDLGSNVNTYGSTNSSTIALYESTDTNSPYIIKPEDELIIGCQVPCPWGWERATDGAVSPFVGPNLTFAAAPGKLTLYGSLVADGHEHHEGLNQPLTSDAIHEFIGFHGPPLDQWDTEPRQQFSGSMLSSVVTGSIFSNRRVIADKAVNRWFAGQATFVPNEYGITLQSIVTSWEYSLRSPSLTREVIVEESGVIFYDSCTPNPGAVYNVDSNLITLTPLMGFGINMGGEGIIIPGVGEIKNPGWPRLFPFESRFAGIERLVTDDIPADACRYIASLGPPVVFGIASTFFGSVGVPNHTGGFNTLQIAMPYGNAMYGVAKIERRSRAAAVSIKNALWGFGSGVSGTVGSFVCTSGPGYYDAPLPTEGFKYGLYNANFRSPSCKFSQRNYGQFRDMHEQRYDTRFFKTDQGRSFISYGPVWNRFVSHDGSRVDPYSTSCSNMSNFSTSSLPYFDDDIRNRGPIVTADLGTTAVSI